MGMRVGIRSIYHDPFGQCPKSLGGDGETNRLSDCPEGSRGHALYQGSTASMQTRDATMVSPSEVSERARCMRHNVIEGAKAGAGVATTLTVAAAAARAQRLMNAFGVAGAVTAGSIGGPAFAPLGFFGGRLVGLGAAVLPTLSRDALVPVNAGTPGGALVGGIAGHALCGE